MLIFNRESKLPAVFSLCDHSGNWPLPFTNNGYPVVIFDLKHGDDILGKQDEVLACAELFNGILGVFASPPCTDFTISGAQYWKQKDEDGRTESSIKIVDSCLEIISQLKPKWWALENPTGRLPTLRTELGKPSYYFNPCDFAGYIDDNNLPEMIAYADEVRNMAENGMKLSKDMINFSINNNLYTKKTGIWGNSNIPNKKYVNPIKFKAKNGDYYSPVHWYSGGKSEKTKGLRSVTPIGYSNAFYEFNRMK